MKISNCCKLRRIGCRFNVIILPYLSLDDRIDGLVVTFTDITAIKKIELELKEAIEALCKCKSTFDITLLKLK